jgi:uncharacterized membrane protein
MHKIPFRNRGREVSRLEAFSDVVFGFAISILVVSLEAPRSYAQLMETMRGMVPFALCFFAFIDIWFKHHHFFRRYALHDTPTIVLNTLLLFVILWYVYPMRFMLTLAAQIFINGKAAQMEVSQARTLFTIYGLGFAAVFWLLGGMYAQAYHRRSDLELNRVEEIDTLESVYDNFITGSIGVLSALLAWTPLIVFSGVIYFSIAIVKTLVGWVMGVKRGKVEAAILAERAMEPER